MQKIAAFICLATLTLARPAYSQVFVSPVGDDANSGQREKPVCSLTKAVELARQKKERRVVLLPGTYFDSAVALTAKDSNLTIESDSARANLVGGVRLTGWEKQDARLWSAPLPTGRNWDVRMLQVNGRFCPRARFPEAGVLTHLSTFDVPWMSTTGGGWKRPPTVEELTTLKYKEGDIPADLDCKSAEITVFHMWDESVSGITENNASTKTIKMNPPLGHPPGAFDVKNYCLWNIKQGMTKPGQWYFDRSHERIVYWPLAGEDMSTAEVLVPTRRVVISIDGATNVTARNLNVSITTVPLITGGFAAGNFDGAVQIRNSHLVKISNLRIGSIAGHAIKIDGGSSSITVENCEIAHCGAGGVYMDGPKNLAFNNLIHDVGLMFPSAMGINGGGDDSSLLHNEIHDTPYSAIAYAGTRIVIANNLIHHCMKVLHDGGAIYSFGSKDAVIRNNVARDITDTGGYGASSYYLDEQSTNCVVENNISINVARPSHNHMATNNIVRNNVFITTGDMRLTFPRSVGYTMSGNVIYATGSITIEGVNNVSTWSKNLFYSGANKIDGVNLKEYSTVDHVSGLKNDSQAGDPLFVDMAKQVLTYKPESPALKLGLKSLSVDQAGRVPVAR